MRWYLFVLTAINGCCLLAYIVFASTSRIKPIFFVAPRISSENWTIEVRNDRRLTRLHEQYASLVDLTAFKTTFPSSHTMIYSCRSFCGGWGDRLRGILSAYALSILSRRRFMIDMHYPCNILDVLQPNIINWTYTEPDRSMNRTRLTINTMPSWQTKHSTEITTMIKSKNFVQAWSSYDDIFISTNSDYMMLAFRNLHLLNETRALLGQLPVSQSTMQTLFALIFELLFKPTLRVIHRVNAVLAASLQRDLICFHIRIGKNTNNPYDHAFTARVNTSQSMIRFTDGHLLNKSSFIVFVTSDSGQAVSDVVRHYPTSSMTVVGPILHIDRFDRQSPTLADGFVKVIADFYLLGECHISLLSTSGFSAWANRRRTNPHEQLYVFNEKLGQITKA